MTTILNIQALPTSPYEGTGYAAIVITSGVPSYFRLIGIELDKIISVQWFPTNPSSVLFETRQLILVSPEEGTFMIKVLDNYLNITDRGGKISFTLEDGSTLTIPVKTYGPVSTMPLWRGSSQGMITG